jgi:hypothetical protein
MLQRVPIRRRFWLELALALATAVAAAATSAWPQWLEALGWDPDHGNGSVEAAIVAALALCTLVVASAAAAELVRATKRPSLGRSPS